MLLKMQSSRAWANVVDVGTPGAKLLVPLTPEAFEAKLAHELECERERHKAAMQLAVERAVRLERASRG